MPALWQDFVATKRNHGDCDARYLSLLLPLPCRG